jgi:murine toxin
MSSLSISSIYDELKKSGAEDKGAYTKSDGNNIVEIIDTPRMWGVPFEEKATIEQKGADAKDKINKIIQFIIQKAEKNIDIVSLAPPTGEFKETILHELETRFNSEHNITLVRFLFGYLPGGEDTVKKFRNDVAVRFSQFSNQNLELYIGRVHGGESGGGAGPLSPWNHAKIITADGRYALVGGHNLWPHNYADYPPVHDLSLFIRGNGAEAAQKFTNFLWTIPGTKGGIRGRGRSKWTRYYKYNFTEGKFPADWESTSASCAAAVVGPVVDYVGDQEYTSKKVTTVLGVGRFNAVDSDIQNHAGVTNSMGYASPSEQVKELVIKAATNRLYICQQDLLFLGAASIAKHNVVKWIVESLTINPRMVVKIVISSINAKSQDGSQYSWGSGALGTYNKLVEQIGQNKSILDRLHVAPFCFTNVSISRDGAGHEWKDSKKYRLKQAQFSTNIPLPRILTSVGKYPEPANHSKFYMAVDESGKAIYYVGSDNLYPHDLFEFGYMIDDIAANKKMYDNYWTNVWKYSGLNCVCFNCRSSARSALSDSLLEYKASLTGAGSVFRRSSAESTRAVAYIEKFLSEERNADQCSTLIQQLIGTNPSALVPQVGKTFKAILIRNNQKIVPSERTYNGAWTYRRE